MASLSSVSEDGLADERPTTRGPSERRTRQNNNKGRTAAKDKRKLREKRRSTGVVHLSPSTESTGDSLDDEEDHGALEATKRNTSYNEVLCTNNPCIPEEDNVEFPLGHRPTKSVRNKSPFDPEDDPEGNRDNNGPGVITVRQGLPQTGIINKFNQVRISSGDFSQHSEEGSLHQKGFLNPTRPSCGPDQDFTYQLPEHGRVPAHSRPVYQNNHNRSEGPDGSRQRQKHQRHERLFRQETQESILMARIKELEQNLECEREVNLRLQAVVEEKDLLIGDLENEVKLLHQDLETVDEENEKLQQDNRTLLQAMARLSSR